jgi:hemoglobin-like flavoprotein
MDMPESLKLVQASKPIFGRLFYERLFTQYPDLEHFFHRTTIDHQAAILTMELSVMEAFYVRESPAAELYLQLLGTKHKDRGIPVEAYPHFRDVLLASLQQFHGTDWSAELAQQWHEAIDASVAKMLDGYKQRVTI